MTPISPQAFGFWHLTCPPDKPCRQRGPVPLCLVQTFSCSDGQVCRASSGGPEQPWVFRANSTCAKGLGGTLGMQELALLPGHASHGTSQLFTVLVAQRGDIKRNPSAEIQKLHHFYHGTYIPCEVCWEGSCGVFPRRMWCSLKIKAGESQEGNGDS